MLRSVASGVVCCRRYAQLSGNRRLGFCIRIASERSKSYWIGCVASNSSDLDAAQPTRDGEHPKLVVPFGLASRVMTPGIGFGRRPVHVISANERRT